MILCIHRQVQNIVHAHLFSYWLQVASLKEVIKAIDGEDTRSLIPFQQVKIGQEQHQAFIIFDILESNLAKSLNLYLTVDTKDHL